MKKTKLVTALYTDISGPPFFGHAGVAREERYFHSLRTLSNTNEEIVLYCNETQLEQIKNFIDKFNLNNVELKVSNLIDYPNSRKMIQIKEETNDFKMYHEIDWNKLYLLEKDGIIIAGYIKDYLTGIFRIDGGRIKQLEDKVDAIIRGE
jgi:hypothetical protein